MLITRRSLMFTAALLSMIVGFPYVVGLFGPTEREVWVWGMVAMGGGLALLVLAWLTRDRWRVLPRIVGGFGYLLLALMQVLPIGLWFQFSGYGISDGTPPSRFVAHWLYAIPHIVLLLIGLCGLAMMVGLVRLTPDHNTP